MNKDLERLYLEAKAALAEKDYNRAADLFRQILKEDVEYKDAAQLLAQAIKLSRRRWHNDPRLWGAFSILLLFGLGIYFLPKLRVTSNKPESTSVILPTDTPAPAITQSVASTATATLLPTPTTIPFTWKRIALGQNFEPDTVSAIVTDPNDPDVIYAGLMHAGVYKSIDGGLSWKPTHQGLTNTEVRSLLIDPNDSSILYAGTDGRTFKTTNGGEHWKKTNADSAYLLMDPQDSSHIYARGDGTDIYESFNGTKSWSAIESKFNHTGYINQWAIDPVDGNTLYLSYDGDGLLSIPDGIYVSIDGGLTWKLVENVTNNGSRFVLGRDSKGNSVLYAYDYPQLQISYNGGTWSGKDFWCASMAVDPGSPETAYCLLSSGRMMGTNNGGYTWRSLSKPDLKYINVMNIDRINGSDRIIAAGSGLYISADAGVSWAEGGSGLAKTLSQLKIEPHSNSTMYLTTYFGLYNEGCTLYRSQNNGQSWSSIMERSNWSWCGTTIDADNFLFTSQNGQLLRSSNNGSTWKSIAILPGNVAPDTVPLYSEDRIFANPYIPGFMYDVSGNTSSIYYSTDSGISWNQRDRGIDNLTFWDVYVYYAGPVGKSIYVFSPWEGYRLDDNSENGWIKCAHTNLILDSDTRLAIDPRDGKHLFAATHGEGVFVSNDGCQTWRKNTTNGMGILIVNTLAIDPNHPNTIFAGTQAGAFVSFNDGVSWHEINNGLLGATVVYSIAIDQESNVYAATPYGIFKLEGK